MRAVILPPDHDTTLRQLTTADRCDRCEAQAWMKTVDKAGPHLVWCAHHRHAHLPAFPDRALEVVADERET